MLGYERQRRETYDDGDYATLRGGVGPITNHHQHHHQYQHEQKFGNTAEVMTDDNTSEEGKLLESVRDDTVTYASTRDLEPPVPPPPPSPPIPPPPLCVQPIDTNNNMSYNAQMISPLAPVTVTVHSNEAHVSSRNEAKPTIWL